VVCRLMADFSWSGEAGGGRLAVIAELAVNICDRSTVTPVNTIEPRSAVIRATQGRAGSLCAGPAVVVRAAEELLPLLGSHM
jgi:hypothetical protein